jgi:hypothetical protein
MSICIDVDMKLKNIINIYYDKILMVLWLTYYILFYIQKLKIFIIFFFSIILI